MNLAITSNSNNNMNEEHNNHSPNINKSNTTGGWGKVRFALILPQTKIVYWTTKWYSVLIKKDTNIFQCQGGEG